MRIFIINIICVSVLYGSPGCGVSINLQESRVWGPGLRADFLVPVRYFFVQLVGADGSNITDSVGEGVITATITSSSGVRVRSQVLDGHDGSYVVRYRPSSSTSDLQISVHMNGHHVADSPYRVKGDVIHEKCNCPRQTSEEWARSIGCPASYSQLERDLSAFSNIDMTQVAKEAVERFQSICHYKIIDNKVYKKCYGAHVGFSRYSDEILLSLARKMFLPEIEFIMNLGDWPLEKRALNDKPIPVLSWCGSKNSHDIVLPTYDITRATVQMMGSVSLDIFSTQANTGPKWPNKTAVAFWRGRDSRRERLRLVEMSLKNPDLIDAKLTSMYFFPKDEGKYGDLAPQISFLHFFNYKYQLNIDGTVAAYRLPYLLAGDAVVLKQESEYYEHFYSELEPNVHYVPVKHDLSDLLEKIRWAKDHDHEVQQIAKNGQRFAREHLTPASILCYHVRVFQQYARLLKKKATGINDFVLLEQLDDKDQCSCKNTKSKKTVRDEL